MSIIILIPTLICIVALFRNSAQKVLLNVVLPIFLLCPTYYFWKVSYLPPVDLSDAILIPLGTVILWKELPRWRFSRMDLWIGVYIVSTFIADWCTGQHIASIFDLYSNVSAPLVVYAAGKVLIEANGGRVAFVKRLVFCLFIAGLISIYEYRMGVNLFSRVMARLIPNEHFGWNTQLRWGFGRVSGPYGQSELAGIMLLFGLVLALWLSYEKLWEPKFKYAEWLPFKKSTVIVWTLFLLLLMTQARGPWLGTLFAVPIAWIGRSRRVLRNSILVGSLCLFAGVFGYVGLQNYANAPVASAEQETASYRAQLLDNYIPVAKQGGAWGWGQSFPRVAGQGSIDNEYLFLALTQGWVGLGAFCLLAAEALRNLIKAIIINPERSDRYFAFSLLGTLIGLLITVFTVFLGNQPYQVFFLLIGWSQALVVPARKTAAKQMAFQQVYT